VCDRNRTPRFRGLWHFWGLRLYIYTPGEPAGVPYQPGPDIDQPYLFNAVNVRSRGRCGACKACPRVWHLLVPTGYGAGQSTWAGNYYLRRTPYEYANSLSDFVEINCSWNSRTAWGSPNYCPISDANHNDFIPGGADDPHGWVLAFLERLPSTDNSFPTWYLRTPIHDAGSSQLQGSWYYISPPANRFRCLQFNEFTYYGKAAEFDFPYLPPSLTITPFYA